MNITPAEAAYIALECSPTPFEDSSKLYKDAWTKAADAAIAAHLATVAEGLPTVSDLTFCFYGNHEGSPTIETWRAIQALFTATFAKLAAERDQWEQKYRDQLATHATDARHFEAERRRFEQTQQEQNYEKDI